MMVISRPSTYLIATRIHRHSTNTLSECRPDLTLFISLYPIPFLRRISQNLGMKLLLVSFVLGQLRLYSYALSGLNEGSAASRLASPEIHSNIGQLFSLNIHVVAHICAITI